MEDNAHVFKSFAPDDTYLCMPKRNILEMLEEINRCEYARSSLLNLIKAADAK